MAAAFDAGLLPADDGALLNLDYFKSKKDEFYQVNYNIEGNKGGPWYNVYSEAFNGFEGQFIYTFAYGDALGQDGTLHDPNNRYYWKSHS